MTSDESSSYSSGSSGFDPSSNSSNYNESRSTTSATSNTSKLSKEEQEQLAERETKMIRRSRMIFVMLLLMLTAVAAGLTYYFTARQESKQFEEEFAVYAHEIEETMAKNAESVYSALNGFSTTVTSFSLYSETAWPNLTVPHFPQRGLHLMEESRAEHVLLSPIVTTAENGGWEAYAAQHHDWMGCMMDLSEEEIASRVPYSLTSNKPREEILAVHSWISESTGIALSDIKDIYQVPTWQMYPMTETELQIVNYDLLSHPSFHRLFHWIQIAKEPVLSEILDIESLFGGANTTHSTDKVDPHSVMILPVYKGLPECTGYGCNLEQEEGSSTEIGALAIAILPWNAYLTNLLPKDVKGITVVVENTCGDVFSYRIDGETPVFLGHGDLHDKDYDYLEETAVFDPFGWFADGSYESNTVNCNYVFHLSSTPEFEEGYHTSTPALLCFAVAMIFAFTTAAFAAYDCLVQRRQEKVMESAMRTNAIVTSLFPAEVRDRLFVKGSKKRGDKKEKMGTLLPTLTEAPKFRLTNFLSDEEKNASPQKPGTENGDLIDILDKPIADLFPSATVMFGDIAGFTAWSSVRDPTQVFTLLETVYRAFDHIARKRRVFKVETIGDSYVAVAGLPDPNPNHATVMCRFARDCLHKMNSLTTKLEEVLGPGTGELCMRFGLNSGPVTAGVLRGEKSRFQLFGDTVNTAARMESNGVTNRIQLSQTTADELKKAGKEHWLEPRKDLIHAKGKGDLQTYWLHLKDDKRTSSVHEDAQDLDDVPTATDSPSWDMNYDGMNLRAVDRAKADAKSKRMVGWTTDILSQLLKQIVARRNACPSKEPKCDNDSAVDCLEEVIGRGESTVLEEVTEFVPLPDFDRDLAERVGDFHQVQLDPILIDQLRLYVSDVASMYRDNPFHNMEHASHVTMSISKLLGRIVSADVAPGDKDYGQSHILAKLHNRTFGLTSDPLVQFAAVFSGLIHDVDHRGVPNFILANEEKEMSAMYKGRSIAEQNSVDIAWERLMEPDLKDLRRCIYTTPAELRRFRQTVVNTIMATDIFDKGCAEIRKRRWDKCFHNNNNNSSSRHSTSSSSSVELDSILDEENTHRKATIVIEHLIQASDVAHTMQHWSIYQKWNQRLFEEMYLAYRTGRSSKNPAENWYVGELGFFDNYIIPLAMKLKECGVFGVSSDEYLNYAIANRQEWEIRGKDLVESAVERLDAQGEATNDNARAA